MDSSQPPGAEVQIRGTARGIALLVAAILLVIASVLTGSQAFAIIGFGIILAIVLSQLELRLSAYQLRQLSPTLSHELSNQRPTAGDSVTLTTTVPRGPWQAAARGLGWQHAPTHTIGYVTASHSSAEPQGDFSVTTRIHGLRRGRWPLGQLIGSRDDLLGLAHLTALLDVATTITVWPTTHPTSPPGTGLDSSESANGGNPTLQTHDDSTLREYTIGDDLRRVHWPSSARHGDLLVKNADASDHGQVSVILYVSGAAGDASYLSTEVAVTLAASVLRSASEAGMQAQLGIPGVTRSANLIGESDLHMQLDLLSAVQPSPDQSDLLVALAHDLTSIRQNDHCILIVAGSLPDGAAQTLRSCTAIAQNCVALVVTEGGHADQMSLRELSNAAWPVIWADARQPRLELERLGASWRR